MPIAASRSVPEQDLVELAQAATGALDALLADAVRKVREKVLVEGRVRSGDRVCLVSAGEAAPVGTPVR